MGGNPAECQPFLRSGQVAHPPATDGPFTTGPRMRRRS